MHDAQCHDYIEEDRDIRALEKQHVRRLVSDIRRLIRVHQKHAGNHRSGKIPVLLRHKAVHCRKDQNDPHDNDHDLPCQHPVLYDCKDRDQQQIRRSDKQYRAVAHPRRKEFPAPHLFQRQLHVKCAVRMEKGLRKQENDPAHTGKQRQHANKQKSLTGSSGSPFLCCLHCRLFLLYRFLFCRFLAHIYSHTFSVCSITGSKQRFLVNLNTQADIVSILQNHTLLAFSFSLVFLQMIFSQ